MGIASACVPLFPRLSSMCLVFLSLPLSLHVRASLAHVGATPESVSDTGETYRLGREVTLWLSGSCPDVNTAKWAERTEKRGGRC